MKKWFAMMWHMVLGLFGKKTVAQMACNNEGSIILPAMAKPITWGTTKNRGPEKIRYRKPVNDIGTHRRTGYPLAA